MHRTAKMARSAPGGPALRRAARLGAAGPALVATALALAVAGLVPAQVVAAGPAAAATVSCGPPPSGLGMAGPTVTLTSPVSNAANPVRTELPTLMVTVAPTLPGVDKITGPVKVAVCLAGSSQVVQTFILAPTKTSGQYDLPVPLAMALLRNGSYTFTATASEDAAGVTTSTVTNTTEVLDAPPQMVQGVRAVPSSDGRSVTVTWNKGPEQDISGYIVERNGKEVSGTLMGRATTSFVDGTTTPGAHYVYDVKAVRPDIAKGKAPLTSAPSALVSVAVPPPSVPHGTNGAPGGVTGSVGGSGDIPGASSGGGGGVTGSVSPPSVAVPSKPPTGAPSLGGFQQNLPYSTSPLNIANPKEASKTASSKEPGPHGYPVWVIALIVLLLAMAGAAFTLRRRLGREPALETVEPQRGGRDYSR